MKISRKKILIVDNNETNCMLLRLVLEEVYRLCVVTSGMQALEILPKLLPDLILLDIVIPVIDGCTVCSIIRQNLQLKHMKIIMVSAVDQTEYRTKGDEAGADDYISPPFKKEELLEKVK